MTLGQILILLGADIAKFLLLLKIFEIFVRSYFIFYEKKHSLKLRFYPSLPIIPYLLFLQAGAPEDAGSAKSGPNKDDIVKLVVRVFVDAVPYIPEHRKMLLFQHFASVLGADSYLYIIIAILLEKVLVQMDLGGDNNHNVSFFLLNGHLGTGY